jgi:outer membrane autotransporter protein
VSAIDQLASASSDGTQLSAAVSFGRDYQRGAWNFGPYFRGTFARVDFDGYTEQLRNDLPGSGLGLAVDGRDIDSMTAVVGGRLTYTASRDWGILMPHVSLEWEHEFQDDPQTLVMRFLHDPTATPIEISGEPLDTDYYNLGIGLSALFPGGKSAFLYYEQLLGASGVDQANLAVGVRFEF